jgi:hypothetical protein
MTVNRNVVSGGVIDLDVAGGLLVRNARVFSGAGQAIMARSVNVVATGTDTAAIDNRSGTQTITVRNGGDGTGLVVTNFGTGSARIAHGLPEFSPTGTVGPQTITIFNGDFLRIIGRGGDARIVAGGNQSVTLRGSGRNALEMGDAAATGNSELAAPNQTIVAGLAGQTGSVNLSKGARIGPLPDQSGIVDLTIVGNMTLDGGDVADSGAVIGTSASSTVARRVDIAVDADGDITLNGGSPGFSRIGHLGTLSGTGDIALVAGGDMVLGGGEPLTGSRIVTDGAVTLRANRVGGSIRQAANSVINAGSLTASARRTLDLGGANRIGGALRLSIVNAEGSIVFTNRRDLTVDAATIDTPTGAQSVALTTTGAADLTLTGAIATDDDLTFGSGRFLLFADGTDVQANSLVFSGAGSTLIPGGTVTLNAAAVFNLPVAITGGSLVLNGASALNAGLLLSDGGLRGAGLIMVSGGGFLWSGGNISGDGIFRTDGATEVTGPVNLVTRTWNNFGRVDETGDARIRLLNDAEIINRADAVWNLIGTMESPLTGQGTFNNRGTFNNNRGTPRTLPITRFTNTGTLAINGGSLTLPTFPVNDGAIVLDTDTVLFTDRAPLTNNGTLSGRGRVGLAGATFTNNGTVSPGASTGTLTITGDFTQTASGILDIEIGGSNSDLLDISGTANLGGTLQLSRVTGGGARRRTVEFLNFGSSRGDFENVTFGADAATLTLEAGPRAYRVSARRRLAEDPELITVFAENDQAVLTTTTAATSETASSTEAEAGTTSTSSSGSGSTSKEAPRLRTEQDCK